MKFLPLLALLVLCSCGIGEVSTTIPETILAQETFTKEEIAQIEELGGNVDEARKVGSWIKFDDLAFYSGVWKGDKPSKPNAQKHYADREVHLVNINSVDDIDYFIHSSITGRTDGTTWINSITQAGQDWNNVANCDVTFNRVLSSGLADITIYMENAWPLGSIDGTTLAEATLPNNGNITIGVGFNEDVTFNAAGILGTMRHEFAHIVGVRHTDHDTETSPGRSAELIRCTDDSPSIMYSTGGSSTIEKFIGDGDRDLFRFLYPTTITQPSISAYATDVGEEYGNLIWDLTLTYNQGSNSDLISAIFDVEEETEYDDGSTNTRSYVDTRNDSECNPTFSYLKFDDKYGNNRCYSYRVRGRNRKGDRVTNWSAWTSSECLSD